MLRGFFLYMNAEFFVVSLSVEVAWRHVDERLLDFVGLYFLRVLR